MNPYLCPVLDPANREPGRVADRSVPMGKPSLNPKTKPDLKGSLSLLPAAPEPHSGFSGGLESSRHPRQRSGSKHFPQANSR